MISPELEEKIIGLMADCWSDPYKFVMTAFPWGTGQLIGFEGPDNWQIEVMNHIKHQIESGDESHIRIAVASGHHIGKTCLVAWLILWFMSTRPNCSVVITAGSGDQLKGTAWRELAKWSKLAINNHWFELTATTFSHKENKLEWVTQARTWSDEDPHKIAGKHAGKDKVMFIFDEASTIPDPIWEVVEGGTQDKRMIFLAFGNPVRNNGKFRECFRDFKDMWWTKQVDSREVKIANHDEIARLVKANGGEDSDYVKMRVRGIFPDASASQFIPLSWINDSMDRAIPEERTEPLIMGVDVGLNHDDSVVVLRQGRKMFDNVYRFKLNDTVKISERVTEYIKTFKPDFICIDCVGIGYAVYSDLKNWGYKVEKVQGSESPDSPQFANKRCEMWSRMKDWLKDGHIPRIDSLVKELISVNIVPDEKRGKIVLDSKEDIRKVLGGNSPDTADALSLTFARNFVKSLYRKEIKVTTDYNIFGD